MWEFIKFLAMVILILCLIAIIHAILLTIYENIKLSIVKRKAIKRLQEELKKIDVETLANKEDVN